MRIGKIIKRMQLEKLWFVGILFIYACNEEETNFESPLLEEEPSFEPQPPKEEETDFDDFLPLEDYSSYVRDDEQFLLFNTAIAACETSRNSGKSVAVFGGSLSSLPESNIAKGLWKKYLHMNIKTYGKGGHGFATIQGNIQNQVNQAAKHDIYILWGSTNDYVTERPLGKVTDYTEYDDFDTTKLESQCGGINYCIKRLREINPQATIYLFTSLKFFTVDCGYKITPTNNNGQNYLYDYVQKQKECARLQNISYLDQWEAQEGRITRDNFSNYYLEDGFHMSEAGYFDIGIHQLLFLAQAE